MFKTTMGKTDEIFLPKVVENPKDEITDEYEEIDASNIITIRNDDGTETNYIPFYDNGQIIMTPITLIKEESNTEEMETDNIEAIEDVQNVDSKAAKYVECNGQLVKTVPIIDPDIKKSTTTRVPPNTYKKTLVNNGNESLIRFGRRHIIIDQKTKINPKLFKQQLLNSSDLVKKLDIAPRSRKQMRYMIEGFTQLFAYPAHSMSNKIRELHKRHCTTRKQNNTDSLDDMVLLPVGYQIDVDRSSIKRITRRRKYNEYEVKRKCPDIITGDVTTTENQIQVLLEAASVNQSNEQYISYYADENSDNGETQIVVIQEGTEDDSSGGCVDDDDDNKKNNIEVLLEAVDKKSENIEDSAEDYQVFITNENFNGSILDEEHEFYIVDGDNEHYIQEKNDNCTFLTIK